MGQLNIQYSILYPWTLTPEPWASLSMLGWGSEVLSDIPGGLGGPTQYSILYTLPLDPDPRTLGIIINVSLNKTDSANFSSFRMYVVNNKGFFGITHYIIPILDGGLIAPSPNHSIFTQPNTTVAQHLM